MVPSPNFLLEKEKAHLLSTYYELHTWARYLPPLSSLLCGELSSPAPIFHPGELKQKNQDHRAPCSPPLSFVIMSWLPLPRHRQYMTNPLANREVATKKHAWKSAVHLESVPGQAKSLCQRSMEAEKSSVLPSTLSDTCSWGERKKKKDT